MKKMIVLATGLAVLATGAYCASLFAQGGANPAPAASAPAGTKIGVVNVGYVFHHWKKAQLFKDELERAAKPYNDQAKKLQDEIAVWDSEIKRGNLAKQDAELRQQNIVKNKRELEDLAGNMRKLLGKRSEDNLIKLWLDAKSCIDRVAEAYGFSIVFGYGDPLDKELMNLFPNINRKMNAMDGGASVPLYVHGSSDLSNAVTVTLNQWYDQQRVPATPTGNQK